MSPLYDSNAKLALGCSRSNVAHCAGLQWWRGSDNCQTLGRASRDHGITLIRYMSASASSLGCDELRLLAIPGFALKAPSIVCRHLIKVAYSFPV
jgi:hypothetical protein